MNYIKNIILLSVFSTIQCGDSGAGSFAVNSDRIQARLHSIQAQLNQATQVSSRLKSQLNTLRTLCERARNNG